MRLRARCITFGSTAWWLCCALVVANSSTYHHRITRQDGWAGTFGDARRKTETSLLRHRSHESFSSQEFPSRRQGVPWRTPDSAPALDGHTASSWRPPDTSADPTLMQQSRQEVSLIGTDNVSLSKFVDRSVSNDRPAVLESGQSSAVPVLRRELHSASLYRFPGQASVLSRNSRFSDSEEMRHKPRLPGDTFRYNRALKTDPEEGRHLFGPDNHQTLAAISETLGAINTVGRYLVNITRGGETDGDKAETENLSGAIYTISKNVLGPNVTDTIAPIVRGAIPPLVTLQPGKVTLVNNVAAARPCTTPDGLTGTCDDLSSCPQLLLDLGNLRQSICFKSLFVPGVCCPNRDGPSTFVTPIPDVVTVPTTVRTTTTTRLTTTTRRPSVVVTSGGPTVPPDADCGQPEVPTFRVVGGEESLPGRWPWMAAIFLHGSRRTEFWCGGSLVGPRHVLTAAHCTRDSKQRPFSPRQFTVRLGDVDLKRDDEPSSPETYQVVEVLAHPRFSRVGFYNDIAVLVLERTARRSRYVIPICLPPARYRHEPFVGYKPTVVGWGTTYYGGKESTVQRQAQLPVWRNDDCDQTYFQPITSSFICAGYPEGGKDACQGDSGGPLMLKVEGHWIQIGIVSFGNKCGEPGYPGVYTRITEYTDWIRENMVK